VLNILAIGRSSKRMIRRKKKKYAFQGNARVLTRNVKVISARKKVLDKEKSIEALVKKSSEALRKKGESGVAWKMESDEALVEKSIKALKGCANEVPNPNSPEQLFSSFFIIFQDW